MILRGLGTAMAREAGSYHPDVKVIIQETAWADVPTVLERGESVFKPWVLKVLQGDRFILFLDRICSQKDPAFIKLVRDLNGETANGPIVGSRYVGWQPVDAEHMSQTSETDTDDERVSFLGENGHGAEPSAASAGADSSGASNGRVPCYGEWSEVCPYVGVVLYLFTVE